MEISLFEPVAADVQKQTNGTRPADRDSGDGRKEFAEVLSACREDGDASSAPSADNAARDSEAPGVHEDKVFQSGGEKHKDSEPKADEGQNVLIQVNIPLAVGSDTLDAKQDGTLLLAAPSLNSPLPAPDEKAPDEDAGQEEETEALEPFSQKNGLSAMPLTAPVSVQYAALSQTVSAQRMDCEHHSPASLPVPPASEELPSGDAAAPVETNKQALDAGLEAGDGKHGLSDAAAPAASPEPLKKPMETSGDDCNTEASFNAEETDAMDTVSKGAHHKNYDLKTRLRDFTPPISSDTGSAVRDNGAATVRPAFNSEAGYSETGGFEGESNGAPVKAGPVDDKNASVNTGGAAGFQKAVEITSLEASKNAAPTSPPHAVFEKLEHGVSLSVAGGGKEVSVTLHPETLGRLHIKVSAEDAKVAAKIVVENASVKHMLDADLGRLKEIFALQGLKLDKYTVEVGSFGVSADGRGAVGTPFTSFASTGNNGRPHEDRSNGYVFAESGRDAEGNAAQRTEYARTNPLKRSSRGIDLFI